MTRSSVLRLFLLCSAVLIVGSLMPNSLKVALHTSSNHRILHPLAHVVAFACFTVLAASLAKSKLKALLAPLMALAFGFVLEFLEHYLYRQPLEISDIWLDACGAVLGYCVFWIAVAGKWLRFNTISG